MVDATWTHSKEKELAADAGVAAVIFVRGC